MSETMNTDEAVAGARTRCVRSGLAQARQLGIDLCPCADLRVLTDMPDKLDKRVIVEPLLSMGYLSLIWFGALGNFVTAKWSSKA